MIVLWLILAGSLSMSIGVCVGFTLKRASYDGIITIEEDKSGKVIFSLVVSGDPELLANQEEARFKIVPPSYENSRR